MKDQIIILKNTKPGIIKDTIMSIQDTIHLNLQNLVKLEQPDQDLVVHTISEPMSVVQVVGLWIGIIVAFVTIVYTFYSIYKLRQSDNDTQKQLNELKGIVGAIEAQNGIINDGNSVMRDYFAELQNLISTGTGSGALAEIENKRFRLSIKPRLWLNVSGYSGYNGEIHFDLNNRGELCYYDGYEFIDGDAVEFNKWKSSIEIPKDGRIVINGITKSEHPKDLVFKIKIFYHDQEQFKYESIIEWNKSPKIIETIEL